MDSIDFIVPAGHHEVVITGEVLEKPTRTPAFETKTSKLVGSLLDGRPFPLGPQSPAYNLRIIEAPASDLSRQTNVLVHGEIYDGRVNAGDLVQVVARENARLLSGLSNLLSGNDIEYTALRITNSTAVVMSRNGEMVESVIRPSFSVPAGVFRTLFLSAAVAVGLLLTWLASGGLVLLLVAAVDLVLALLYALGPLLVVACGFWWMLKAVGIR